MASLNDLARQHTSLAPGARDHLRRLVGSWGLLSDVSFADLLLFVPTSEIDRFLVVGQIRPTTAQTLYRDDQVGTFINAEHRPLVTKVLASGETVIDEIELHPAGQRASVQAVPVRHDGALIGVLTIETPQLGSRPQGELELVYRDVYSTLVEMVAAGAFPYANDDAETEQAPRVGDGVVVLNSKGVVVYSSPNATSALHRMGFRANTVGRELTDLGFQPDFVRTAFRLRVPVTEEIERGMSVTILARLLPLVISDRVDGALLLMRDVSELRRQERLLVSMDATIREIHHRVKNNLQTVSSLLRLQGRRVEVPEAKQAIEESVRRIRSIALVHEILAQDGGDDVALQDLVRPIVEMVESALIAPERAIKFRVIGSGLSVPAPVGSSLAVILTEFLQNAVEHGFPDDADSGQVTVELVTSPTELVVSVHDDGVGLPEGFDLETSSGLGLTIVRTLASGDLGGELSIRQGDRGTTAQMAISLVRAS